jgi:hypothetical protein
LRSTKKRAGERLAADEIAAEIVESLQEALDD